MFKYFLLIASSLLLNVTQAHAESVAELALQMPSGMVQGIELRQDHYVIKGWLCQSQKVPSVMVDLYLNNSKIKSMAATLSHEPKLRMQCAAPKRQHQFAIPLSLAEMSTYAGQRVQVKVGNMALRSQPLQIPSQLSPAIPFSVLAQKQGNDVTIPKGVTAVIDSHINKGNITVEGKLLCPERGNFEFKVDNIMVHGDQAVLECGTDARPFKGNIAFIFKNNRIIRDGAGKEFMAMHGGTIRLTGAAGKNGYVKLNKTANIGNNSLTLDRPVAWQIGDTVVIASSSVKYQEAETATISALSLDRRTISLNKPLQYRHWGETESFSNGKTGLDARRWSLDERAEVANLTRNIKIMSEQDANTNNYIGAHLMIMATAFGYINNVEFTRVGQMGILGRYPFHWHMAGNVKGQFIKNSSIHDSYQRCITIHASHYALVENNTCYDHFGHGFFLEDGNERKNIIRGNLGLGSKIVPQEKSLLDSETNVRDVERFRPPATYWISNPDNQIVNNVAAGSAGTGFWFAPHNTLDCDSSNACPFDQVAATNTNLLQFDNNVAHSALVGITHDGAPNGESMANPRNPKDRKVVPVHYAPSKAPIINNLTIYKNAITGHYYRGNKAYFKNLIYADNAYSAFWAYNQELHDSLVVGYSRNTNKTDISIAGIRMYDGPFLLKNVHFANFPAQTLYNSDGRDITPSPFSMTGAAADRYQNLATGLTFSPTPLHRMMPPEVSYRDPSTISIRDIDGSLGGQAGTVLQANNQMNNDSSCSPSPYDARALVCRHKIGYLKLLRNVNPKSYLYNGKFSFTRNRGNESIPSPTSQKSALFSLILDQGFRYSVNYTWEPMTDDELFFDFTTAENDNLPAYVSFENMGDSCRAYNHNTGKLLPAVANPIELANLPNAGLYREGSTLHFKLYANQPFYVGEIRGAPQMPLKDRTQLQRVVYGIVCKQP